MSSRIAAIMLVFWSFTGLPALCEAGEVEHACACACDTCANGDTCDHETDCPDDPCNVVVVSRDSRTRDDLQPHVAADLVSMATADNIPCDAVVSSVSEAYPSSRLPYPNSDRPLRI